MEQGSKKRYVPLFGQFDDIRRRSLASHVNDRQHTGNLGRPERLDRCQPGHEEDAFGRSSQDIAHEVGGTASRDIMVQLVLSGERNRFQLLHDFGQLHDHHFPPLRH